MEKENNPTNKPAKEKKEVDIPTHLQANCPLCEKIVHRDNDLQLFGLAHCWGCYHKIKDYWKKIIPRKREIQGEVAE